MLGSYCMPFPVNQVMSYFCVFIALVVAICLAVVHAMVSQQEYLHHHFGLNGTIFSCMLYPTTIKPEAEW